jgi:hypothetical protein
VLGGRADLAAARDVKHADALVRRAGGQQRGRARARRSDQRQRAQRRAAEGGAKRKRRAQHGAARRAVALPTNQAAIVRASAYVHGGMRRGSGENVCC